MIAIQQLSVWFQVDNKRLGTELQYVVEDNKTLTAALDTLKIDYDDLKYR